MSYREPSEFRRFIDIEKIEGQGHTFSIEADIRERNALARRFGVVAIESLAARGTIVQGVGHSRVCLRAHLEAEVVQQCVVSLQAVIQRISVEFSREYDRGADDEWANLADGGEEIFLNPDSDDLPEPIVGEAIDVGDVVAEQLALELDPFPRASGSKLDVLALKRGETSGEDDQANPFAALSSVRARLKKGR